MIITAKPASGDLAIFQGITILKSPPKDTKIGDYIVDFTATESPTWPQALPGFMMLNLVILLLRACPTRISTFIALDVNTSYLAEPPENQISVKQSKESLVWRPGAPLGAP